MCDERTEPKHRVMTPIGPAISLPPCTSDCVGAHAEPHSKLEDTCKSTGRRQADNESLQNPQFRICLHDPDQQQCCLGGHKTIGIEGDGKFVLGTPLLAEIPNVTGLKAGVDGASTISHRDAAVPDIGQLRETLPLYSSDLCIARVTQYVHVKTITKPRLVETGQQWVEIANHSLWQFVADTKQNGRRCDNRLVAADARCLRDYCFDRI